jgi:hypothetical protein
MQTIWVVLIVGVAAYSVPGEGIVPLDKRA